jgi:transposase-like protein
MSTELDDEIKRWTAKRKSALILEILQGKQSISEASRLHDVTPAEIKA